MAASLVPARMQAQRRHAKWEEWQINAIRKGAPITSRKSTHAISCRVARTRNNELNETAERLGFPKTDILRFCVKQLLIVRPSSSDYAPDDTHSFPKEETMQLLVRIPSLWHFEIKARCQDFEESIGHWFFNAIKQYFYTFPGQGENCHD